jgi:hypothetical protein
MPITAAAPARALLPVCALASRRRLLPLLLLLAAPAVVVPTSASAATSGSRIYAVTFKAELQESWQYRESFADDCQLTGALCTREEVGQGATRTTLRTRRPHRLTVLRGTGKRPPVIGADADPVPLVGETVRAGSLKTTYGGPWKAGNPDRAADDEGCGRQALREEVSFAWRGTKHVAPSIVLGSLDGACPDGPSAAPTWKDDASPSLMDVLASASPSRFRGTKQFTIRGSRTFTGAWPSRSSSSRTTSLSSSGDTKATWSWEATFRLVKRR